MPSLYDQLYLEGCSSHGPLSLFIGTVLNGYPICDVILNRLNTSKPRFSPFTICAAASRCLTAHGLVTQHHDGRGTASTDYSSANRYNEFPAHLSLTCPSVFTRPLSRTNTLFVSSLTSLSRYMTCFINPCNSKVFRVPSGRGVHSVSICNVVKLSI
jgi:hypothetical protein